MQKKDNKGRKLETGETQLKDGTYCYRVMVNGKRTVIYAKTLQELRDKRKDVKQDIDDGINIESSIKKITLNELFKMYLSSRMLKPNTKIEYEHLWNNYFADNIGRMKVCDIKTLHINQSYVKMANNKLSNNTIKRCHTLVNGSLEMAVDNDIIRKNPARKANKKVGTPEKKREALSIEEQENLYSFLESSNVYNVHLPMVKIMINTACRIGEILALTWSNIDFENDTITVNGALVYKDFGNGHEFHEETTKTISGNRIIPMSNATKDAFMQQKRYNELLRRESKQQIGSRKDFIFITQNGNPMMPNAVNSFLKNCVDKYNLFYPDNPLPHISAHVLRHTGCTRMVESGMDLKVVQYIMGHNDFSVTMNVYSHVTGRKKVIEEYTKMDNFYKGRNNSRH